MGSDVTQVMEVRRGIPTPYEDGGEAEARGGRYGEQYVLSVVPKMHNLADEGTYYIASSPTPGTGLPTIAALTALVDTSPFIFVRNNFSVTDPLRKRIYLDYLKLICTAAGTAGASIRYAVKIDSSRIGVPTGGTLITPNNVNMDFNQWSQAQIYAGALVAPAANSPRLLGSGLIRPVIPVVGDTYIINFGGMDPSVGSLAPAGTANSDRVFSHAPVSIGAQQIANLHIWLPSQSAASSYECELGYWER